jgi:endoglucanase
MTSTAADLSTHITLGWNCGNTLEATGGETNWGNPMITQALMDKVKALGFDAVRLPCSWDQNADAVTGKISDAWLNRVKDVVQYCMNANLYVVLNIHWDRGWLELNVNAASKTAVAAKQKAFWEQIATKLRDFDQRLMFASANEPYVDFGDTSATDVLLAYHQTFIDAVRSTGGKNAHRVLVIQGPSTDIAKTEQLWKTMPVDTVANRLMFEVHFYSPFQFALLESDQSWGKMFYYWGNGHHSTIEPERNATHSDEALVDQEMLWMKTQFVDKGIPVILGEYGCMRRTTPLDMATHNAAVTYWMKYVTQRAVANGIMPFVWDIGNIIDRRTLGAADPASLDAVLEGGGKK